MGDFLIGMAAGVAATLGATLLLVLAVARPGRATYAVHYHDYDENGQRMEGTLEIDAMHRAHARDVAAGRLFGKQIDNVERVGDAE